MRRLRRAGWAVAALAALPAAARDDFAAMPPGSSAGALTTVGVCELIEAAAGAHAVPASFLTRLIWKESTFRADAVSPKGAQGIAQFMPGTAREQGLADPFDPVQAIPASARYLRQLRGRFGNLGLAAAAYNAGPDRVAAWLAGDRSLPLETEDFVFTITGRAAVEWMEGAAEAAAGAAEDAARCVDVAAGLARGELPRFADMPTAWGPWGVQVAAGFSRGRVLAAYARLQGRFPAAMAGATPMLLGSVNRSRGRGAFYQARVPAETREAASDLCRRLQAAGGACLVLKTPER